MSDIHTSIMLYYNGPAVNERVNRAWKMDWEMTNVKDQLRVQGRDGSIR